MMEARLLHARKVNYPNPAFDGWKIIDPERRGIRVTVDEISKIDDIMSIDPEVMLFLLAITGDGGLWEGWRLHTIGSPNHAVGETPAHFDFVLAREAVAVTRGVDDASQTTVSEYYTPQSHTPPAYQEAAK